MRLRTLCGWLAAITLCASAALAQEKPLDVSNLLGQNDRKAVVGGDDLPPGDGKEFEFITSSDGTTINVGDIYSTDTPGEKTQFQVAGATDKASNYARLSLKRIHGVADPTDKLKRVQGGGPDPIVRRITLLDLYRQGGPFLHPIAVLGLLTIILGANGVWVYRYRRQIPPAFVAQCRERLKAGDIKGVRELALNERGLLPFAVRAMTERFKTSSLEDIKERTEIFVSAQVHRLRLPVKLLNLISVAAPLLGLLGTIVGMVIVFEAVAGQTGAAKAAALAAGIRVKLFATAMALIVAIPSLFLYFIFNSRLQGIISETEMLAEQFMHRLALIKRSSEGNGHAATAVPEPDEEEPVVRVTPAKRKAVADDEDEA